jgi:hypothetical protein
LEPKIQAAAGVTAITKMPHCISETPCTVLVVDLWRRRSNACSCPEAVIHGGGKVGRVGLDSVVPYSVTILKAVVKRAGYRSPALPSLA